jgi:hypothetical protein
MPAVIAGCLMCRRACGLPKRLPPLDRPGVVALVGERVAAGVAEHVRVCLEIEAGGGGRRPLDHSRKARAREWGSARRRHFGAGRGDDGWVVMIDRQAIRQRWNADGSKRDRRLFAARAVPPRLADEASIPQPSRSLWMGSSTPPSRIAASSSRWRRSSAPVRASAATPPCPR